MSMSFDLVCYVCRFCRGHRLDQLAALDLLRSIHSAIEWDWEPEEMGRMVEQEWGT